MKERKKEKRRDNLQNLLNSRSIDREGKGRFRRGFAIFPRHARWYLNTARRKIGKQKERARVFHSPFLFLIHN